MPKETPRVIDPGFKEGDLVFALKVDPKTGDLKDDYPHETVVVDKIQQKDKMDTYIHDLSNMFEDLMANGFDE